MISQDRIDRLDVLIRQAESAGNDAAARQALELLVRVLQQNAEEAARACVQPLGPDPMTRAREGQPDGLRKLRKGRDRCSATRRDGQPCQAPAVEGSWVCRHHGGGAPQVQIRAGHTLRLQAAHEAVREFDAARGTPGEFDALCKALAAQREVQEYEAKLRLLAELRAEVKRQRAERGTVRTARPNPEEEPSDER